MMDYQILIRKRTKCRFMPNDKFKPGDVVYCEFKNTDENTVLLKKKV